MVSDNHYIELYINKELIELESQDSLNLRMNNVLFNPTKTTTRQVVYSYSFEIPSTPNNDRILNYANNLSKLSKFKARYPAEVYADGNLIFDGSLTVQGYSGKDKKYTCNLVNIKVNTLEEIFDDEVLTDLEWMIDFSGGTTINSINADASSKYFFPLVAYGVFQKDSYFKDEVAADYTPKHDLDQYNKWWVESFFPSLNMTEVLKKAFESKGYSVAGSVFSDPYISNVYCSCNLAAEQSPDYNIGNPLFGHLNITSTWNNYTSINEYVSFGNSELRYTSGGLQQDLNFPYQRVKPAINASNSSASEEFNFATVDIWNMLDSTYNSGVTVTVNEETYMYDPNEHLIVIPADGWYKINITTSASLSGYNTSFSAMQWTNTYNEDDEFRVREVSFTREFTENTPLEIQLIRNYDENIELIKGTKIVAYVTGNHNQSTYTYQGGSYSAGTYVNKTEWDTDFPHQNLYSSKAPTKTESVLTTVYSERTGGMNSTEASRGNGTFGGGNLTGSDGRGTYNVIGTSINNSYGYIHKDGEVMPYDPAVSPAFICGFSTMGNGTMSVMRNGRSWSNLCSINNKIFADVEGMDLHNKVSGGTQVVDTEYCANEYKNSTNSLTVTPDTLSGQLQCCVYLNKNDVLELVAVQRSFDGQKYCCSATTTLEITAMSFRSETELRADSGWTYNSTTECPEQLNLFNFTNKETTISSWIDDVQKAFNLDIIQEGNSIEINTNQNTVNQNIHYAVNVDDRVSDNEYESEFISYPKEMSVQYKIDTEEYGFELTVPSSHINDDDWADYGDSGFTIIQLNDDSYETSTQNTSLNFSYTYYDIFNWKKVLSDGTEDGTEVQISIPVIEKSEYMAEGYGYEEAMKHDGYSMTQRFWYRQSPSQQYVWLSSHSHEQVYLTYPINSWNGFNLSYKDTEKSIATEYFNIHPMLSSNYVTIEVYLNPQEYSAIVGGALIHYDSDLYYVGEISGYDPSGKNTTELKLIKKI